MSKAAQGLLRLYGDIVVWTTLTHVILICRCIPKYRVCLSDSSDCPQYECIDRPAACDKNSVEPACDTDGLVHPSLCHLQLSGKTLAYMGYCQVGDSGVHREPRSTAHFTLAMLLALHPITVVCCQEACRKLEQVCGYNGETYNTVCDAFSDRVAVDYQGSCHAVGTVSDLASDSACSLIQCPPLSTPGCQPVTPPGERTSISTRKLAFSFHC